MATGTQVQSNFTAGEISPRLLGRTDLVKYTNGVRTLRNFIVQKHGGISNRPGTRFVAATKHSGNAFDPLVCCDGNQDDLSDSATFEVPSYSGFGNVDTTGYTRLIPFQFSVTDTYVLEFGEGYIRFFKDDGVVTAGATTTPFELPVPFQASELDAIKFTQSADILYLCHPNYPPMELLRFDDDDWDIQILDVKDGPYGPINIEDDKFIEVSTLTLGSVTLTATGAGWGGVGPFKAGDLGQTYVGTGLTTPGRLFRIKTSGTQWGWGRITGITSSLIATAELIAAPLDAATATTDWRLGEWYESAGWPWVPAFHQERLWFGGRGNDDSLDTGLIVGPIPESDDPVPRPQTIWASVSGNFKLFQPSDPIDEVTDDADALNFTISDDQVNAIRWMVSTAKGLLVGASGGEFVVQSSDVTTGISPTNIAVFRQSNRGSKPFVRPAQVGNAALFVQRHGRKLREMIYVFERDQHVSADLTLISEHISADRFKWISFMAEPSPVLWAVDEEGHLLSMTYEREQEVVAWARHEIGGSFRSGEAEVESIAVVPEDDFDRLWMIVKRTIDGKVERYVEFLTDPFETGDTVLREAFFVDSGLTYDGWNTEVCERMKLTTTAPASGSSGSSTSSTSSSSPSSSSSTTGGGDPWIEAMDGYLHAICHSPFSASSVGRVYRFEGDPDADPTYPVDVVVTEFIDAGKVKVRFKNDIPAHLQDTATASWALTASILTGLGHLEGETVALLVDGGVHPDLVVENGQVDLTLGSTGIEFATFAAVAHVGLRYQSTCRTLPMTPEMPFETRGKQKGSYKIHLLFHETVGARVGVPGGAMDPIPFRAAPAPMGVHVELFTGRKTVQLEGPHDRESDAQVIQSDPLPITVLSMVYELDVNAI